MADRVCKNCGRQLTGSQKKYCCRECRAASLRQSRPCVVCGKQFDCPPSSPVYTCSPGCAALYRSQMMADRPGNMEHIAAARKEYAQTHTAELYPTARHYLILSPSGEVYDILNLRYWVYHCGLFDNPKNAYDAFVKIIGASRREVPRPKDLHQYKGYTIIADDDGNLANSKANLRGISRCKVCGAQLPTSRRSYCSRECRNVARLEIAKAVYREKKQKEKNQ